MTNAIDIHAKSRARTELDRITACARVLLSDPYARIKQSDKTERLFTLDLGPADVATDHVQGPLLMGTLSDEHMISDLAAPVRYVTQQFGKLQTINTSTDLSKLKRPVGAAVRCGTRAREPPRLARVVQVARARVRRLRPHRGHPERRPRSRRSARRLRA
jgi:hypothetical protein